MSFPTFILGVDHDVYIDSIKSEVEIDDGGGLGVFGCVTIVVLECFVSLVVSIRFIQKISAFPVLRHARIQRRGVPHAVLTPPPHVLHRQIRLPLSNFLSATSDATQVCYSCLVPAEDFSPASKHSVASIGHRKALYRSALERMLTAKAHPRSRLCE